MLEGIPPTVANILIAELAPGERVVWYATPSLGRKLRDPIITFLLLVIVMVVLTGMLWIHYLAAPLSEFGTRLEVTIDGILFCAIFVVLALSFLMVWPLYRRTLYAITDRRAILIHAAFCRRIQSFTGEQLIRAVRIEDKRGDGSILFDRNIGFAGLKDVRAVAKLLRRTHEAGAQS